MFVLTVQSVLTMLLMGVTVWVGYARFSIKEESNWPLFYYLAVFAYSKKYDDVFSPYWIYVGVVNALFLRFEFLGGIWERIPRLIELVFLCYIFWHGMGAVLGWR